nr:Chain D, Protein SSD1 [Saccharomyces cerevisiae]
TTEQSDFKFP